MNGTSVIKLKKITSIELLEKVKGHYFICLKDYMYFLMSTVGNFKRKHGLNKISFFIQQFRRFMQVSSKKN